MVLIELNRKDLSFMIVTVISHVKSKTGGTVNL